MEPFGLRFVQDPIPGAGPLAGIAAGLEAAKTPLLVVVAGVYAVAPSAVARYASVYYGDGVGAFASVRLRAFGGRAFVRGDPPADV